MFKNKLPAFFLKSSDWFLALRLLQCNVVEVQELAFLSCFYKNIFLMQLVSLQNPFSSDFDPSQTTFFNYPQLKGGLKDLKHKCQHLVKSPHLFNNYTQVRA